MSPGNVRPSDWLEEWSTSSVGVSFMGNATEESKDSAIGMGAITGIPLACGIKLLADGSWVNLGYFLQRRDT